MDFHQRLDALENRLKLMDARTDTMFAMLIRIISLLEERDHNEVAAEWSQALSEYLKDMLEAEETDPDVRP